MTAVRVPDLDSSPSRDTLALVRGLLEDASREKRKLIGSWNRFERLVQNKAWSEFRADWLPKPASSEVYPTLATLAAYMTSQRPHMLPHPFLESDDVQPDPGLLGEKSTLMRRTLESWWQTSGAGRNAKVSIWDMLKQGTGILKTGWDSGAGQDGDASLRRVDPYNVLPDPSACGLHDLNYLLEVSEPSFYEIQVRFPRTAGRLPRNAETTFPYDRRPDLRDSGQVVSQFQPINRTGEFPGTATTGQSARYGWPGVGFKSEDFVRRVQLVEAWVRETDRQIVPVIVGPGEVEEMEIDVPRWRFIAVAGGVLLADMENPFGHGQLPYVRVPFLEDGNFWSPCLVEHLALAQIALNRILASLQMNIELAGNPILVDSQNSGLARTAITNRPGGRLTESAPGQIRWLDPPRIASEMLATAQNWRDMGIDRPAGVGAVNRGDALRRREAASVVDVSQEAAGMRVGDTLTNVEDAYRQALSQVANLIGDFYIEPRTLPSATVRGGPPTLVLPPKSFTYPFQAPGSQKIKDLPVRWEVSIEAGSSLPLSHSARASEAMSLFFAGVVDQTYVLETLDLPGWEGIAERMAGQPAPEAKNPRKG